MTESFNTAVNSHWEGGARGKELQRKVYMTSSRESQVGKCSSCLHPRPHQNYNKITEPPED